MPNALSPDELAKIEAYWSAANFLSVGQIYLKDNPMLRRPLVPEDIKPRLLGHFGTTPGLNFIYVHLNRLIRQHPGQRHVPRSAPATARPASSPTPILEGTYTETLP